MALRDHAVWWSGLIALPVLLGQALHTRRTTPLLTSAPAPHSGMCGSREGSTLAIYLVGESTVAGVGARDHAHGLSGQLALRLAEGLARTVRWEALGLNGVRARDCLEGLVELELVPRMREVAPDLVVVVLGVNDTTKLTSRGRWREALREIIERCRLVTQCPIVFTGIPPIEQFTALAWPLRAVVGARARMLDEDMERVVAGASGCWHFPIAVKLAGEDLASDGFHPSESGYARWARELALVLASLVRPSPDE